MAQFFKLNGKIQHYAWGGSEFIPNLLGIPVNGEPHAEYWMGGHQNAPSLIETSEGERALDSYISENKAKVLGDRIADQFGRLPFLFKVLDVKDMLSIQVHPTKAEAEKGYRLENEQGIPLNAPDRNYKDDNHKPEVMVALSEFWLLHGFLNTTDLKDRLAGIEEFKALETVFEREGYFGLYSTVMQQDQSQTDETLRPLLERILPAYQEGRIPKSSPDYWAAKAVNGDIGGAIDKGIYSIYFFNLVQVQPGEAVFQDAGIPHAYLEGQNMELMANSDNVLRAGLTPKHIDVPELLKHVVFEETIPNIMQGEVGNQLAEKVYPCPVPDFELSKIEISGSTSYASKANTAQILLVVEGELVATNDSLSLSIKKGEAIFVEADASYELQTAGQAVIYKATAP